MDGDRTAGGCLDANRAVGFVQRLLPGAASADVELHIDRCSACRHLVSELAKSLATGADAPKPAAPSTLDAFASGAEPADQPLIDAGTRIGRYIVIATVGAGGMGAVYAAYDSELDRKIALKLLRPDLWSHSDRGALRARLRKEAQAMARLSHPNVLAVHDIDVWGEQLFVAMEFVEGITLAEWLRAERRSWRQVLSRFLEAGRGLAAVHAAGLVHRDFKPHNVLCGRDGRVRVTDFGLAQPVLVAPDRCAAMDGPAQPGPAAQATRTGPFVGTPAYMAPEQYLGRGADARTDQFSFCVSLYEGLYGRRPFRSQTADSLTQEVVGGRVQAPPPDAKVPAWVRRVLLRGLSVEPTQRFASMELLLDALARDPRARRLRGAGVAGALALLLAGAFGIRSLHERERLLCQGAERKLGGIWDPMRKQAVHAAFLASERPYARDAWARVDRALDAYGRAWVSEHIEACQATRVRGEQSEATLDRRMSCLDGRLRELSALTGVMAQADADVVERAVQAAQSLTPPASCADLQTLAAQAQAQPQSQSPNSELARDQLGRVREQLAQASALSAAGRYAAALKVASAALETARALHNRFLEADALYQQGVAQQERGETRAAQQSLKDALWAAEAGRNDPTAARVTARLVSLAARTTSYAEAREWAHHAGAALERLGGDDEIEAQLETSLGNLSQAEGHYVQALGHHERALAKLEQRLGPAHPKVAYALHNLGNVLWQRGQYEEAVASHRRALAILEDALGPAHPRVAAALTDLGGEVTEMGACAEAVALLERALAILEDAGGPKTPLLAGCLEDLGDVALLQDDDAKAWAYYQRALTIARETLGPKHAQLALFLQNLASVLERQGRAHEALAYYRQAWHLVLETGGSEHPDLMSVLTGSASVLAKQGRHQQALRSLRRALAVGEKTLGSEHPELAATLNGLGRVYLDLRMPERAAALLERALALAQAPGAVRVRPQAGFLLAQALWDAGRDPRRARQLATQARDLYAQFSASRSRSEVDSWLRKHAE